MGTLLSRPLRRQDNQAVTKVRVVASGSGRYPHRCIYDTMDSVSSPLCESSMESDIASPEEDQAGMSTYRDPGNALLAECSLDPITSTDGPLSTSLTTTTSSADKIAQNTTSPSTTVELDALRVATIRHQLLIKKNLNAQAVEAILEQKLAPSGTNMSYRKNQLRFLEWAIRNNVSFTSFSPVDLVNFLADMRNQHNLQASNLKTLRAAVSHLHDESKGIRESTLINSYIESMTKQAPPIPIHRPTIDISPALTFTRSIASRTTTSIKPLQQKLVFLLAMAAFLRPSDLARIPYDSCSITDSGCLTFQVVAPKETLL
ncbi:hypothetical protein G6F42_023983 [Rhizopus arrhizus]|nr:hypothetical protein G6F42_023983 [Rhizopus arrhizus]